jgi:hypothetical protein
VHVRASERVWPARALGLWHAGPQARAAAAARARNRTGGPW